MKLLFTADLHLNIDARHPRTGRTAFQEFSEILERENPEAVVVAGDIGAIGQAPRHLVSLRKAVGDRLLAISLGNHDFWMESYGHSQFSRLDHLVTRFWQEPAQDVGAVLLDRDNADLGDLAIVGGYGHYDLGLAEPGLVIFGVPIREDIYLSGGTHGLFWNDFRYIPNCAKRLFEEAREQAAGISSRMDAAIHAGKRLLLAFHTCPWRQLNGHPLSGTASDILSAYSGNSLVGNEVEKRASSVDFLMCGHTHMPVKECALHGIPCLNVGADYGIFRGVIYDTADGGITWIGEPVDAGNQDGQASGNKGSEKPKVAAPKAWWDGLSTIREPYPHIPEKEILAAMPKDLHSRWNQFLHGHGVLAMDNGDAGIYPCDFAEFLSCLDTRSPSKKSKT